MDESDLRRLRWRCRRGMLELDLILDRFWDVCGQDLTEQNVHSLTTLLSYPDPFLLDVFMGRSVVDDPDVSELVSMVHRLTYYGVPMLWEK